MATAPTQRKLKCSFTLTPASVAFVKQSRERLQAASDSEALDLLLREKMLAMKQAEIDAAYKDYYDTVSDEVLTEQREWAEMASRGMWADIPE
ncbi:MAG TPA: hypothetical protein VME23_08425 [Terracidiphilus sp.]|nr:hypothetical protein [Terracidiphilus sp.]